jgi:hypothetical protein
MSGNGHCHSFNGDGKLDILARTISTGELFVFPHSGRFDGANTFRDPVKIGENFHNEQNYVLVRTIDIDGNGRADVVALGESGHNPVKGVFLFYNKAGLNGMDTLTPPIAISGARPDKRWETLGIRDLTGNGVDDMFGRGKDAGNVDGFYNRGMVVENDTYDREPVPLTTVDVADFPLAMADFTGSGRDDLLVLRGNGDLEIYEFPADITDGNATGQWFTIGNGWQAYRSIAVTDIDLDGKPDLLTLGEDGTLRAHVHSGKFDPDRPTDLFSEPEVLFTGWTDFDVVT